MVLHKLYDSPVRRRKQGQSGDTTCQRTRKQPRSETAPNLGAACVFLKGATSPCLKRQMVEGVAQGLELWGWSQCLAPNWSKVYFY